MGVATGDSRIRIADSKVSAVHGGDPKDYAVMEMLPLFEHVCDYVNQEFPGNHFVTAHFDHMMATAIWRLDGQADKLLDTYRREVAAKGLNPDGIVPALRFTTSDVGMSGANLYPIFLNGNGDRIIPLGYPIKTDHRNGVDLDYFDKQLALLYARYCASIDAQIKLLDIEIQYPATTMLGVLKNVIIGCVVAIYMLASWEKFGAQARIMLYGLVSEKPADWIYNELKLTNSLFGGFISGKLVDSAIIGVICFVVCALLNMPYALLVSVIVGAICTAGQRHSRNHEHYSVLRTLPRCGTVSDPDPDRESLQMRYLHCIHHHPSTDRRERHRSQDPRRQDRRFEFLDSVRYSVFRQLLGRYRNDRRRSAIRRHI